MEIRLCGHGAYRTEYHIVWIPEYRHRILNPGVKGYLEKLFPKILEQMPGCEIIEYNIQPDHIHMVMIIPPKYAVSNVVGKMNRMTSSELRKKFGWLPNDTRGRTWFGHLGISFRQLGWKGSGY